MVARARVSFSAGGASYRLDGTRRDDDTIVLDISLREQGDPQEQVIGGLLVAIADLPLLRAALDRVLRELDPTPPKAYSVQAVRQDHPAAYARWTPKQEEELLREFDAGRTVDELAELLGRQPGGIRSRLRQRGRLDNSTGPGAAGG
jgi:DNA-directed RNA polymerase specialized sigma24 family protein